MHEAVKALSINHLRQLWVSEFAGRIDMEDNWITEGCRFVKWEVKNPRKSDTWAFSMTLALAMSGITQSPPQPMAELLAARLSDSAEPGWTFVAENGYINAYFAPSRLAHYFRGRRSLQLALAESVKGGAYALYRLDMIRSALLVKGVQPACEEALLSEDLIQRFGQLFDLPADAETAQAWSETVGKLTMEGKLVGLQPEEQGILLTFIQKALPR